MKIKRMLPWIITFLVFVLFFFTAVKLNTISQKYRTTRQILTDSLAYVNQNTDHILLNLVRNYENNGAKLNIQNEYINNDNKKVKLADLASNGVLIFHFADSYCMECVYSALSLLDSLEAKLGKSKVVVLATFSTKEAMIAFAEANNIHVPVLFLESNLPGLPIEKENKSPYFFFLDKEGNMKNFFVPDNNFSILTKIYIEKMSFCLNKTK